MDAHGSVSRRAGAQRWKALRPGEPVDEDRCPAGRLLAGRRKRGGPCLVARDARGRLRSSREERPGQWSEWERVDGDRVGEPAMVSTPNGLELFAPSERGLERFREEEDDDWEQLAPIPASLDLAVAVAVAEVAGGTLVVGRLDDGALAAHRVGAGGWTALGASTLREPALLSLGASALAVWLEPDERVAARALAADGAPAGPIVKTAAAPGLSSLGGFHLSRGSAGRVRVALADAVRRVRVLELDPTVGFTEAAGPFDVAALGAPLVVGGTLFVKVAHDILVRRAI